MKHLRKVNQMFALISNIFLMVSALVIAGAAFFLYLDLRVSNPMYEVSALPTDAAPGGISYIQFTYTRPYQINGEVLDRWLICDDGTVWNVRSAAATGNASWPQGINQMVRVPILIPTGVESGQPCYYGSKVKFKRYILNDIILRNPPLDVRIEILDR